MSPCLTSESHKQSADQYRLVESERDPQWRRRTQQFKTNLTANQMVIGGDQVKGRLICNNRELLK